MQILYLLNVPFLFFITLHTLKATYKISSLFVCVYKICL